MTNLLDRSVIKTVLFLCLFSILTFTLALFWALPGFSPASSEFSWQLVQHLRLPRALTAFTCGLLLSLAGVQMQALMKNPLADPFILGTASGASALALLSLVLGLPMVWLQPAALMGAIVSSLILLWLALRTGLNPLRLLLSGVALATAWSAVSTLILSLSPNQQTKGLLFWLMGDLSFSSFHWFYIPLSIIACIWVYRMSDILNILSMGQAKALSLGVSIQKHGVIILLSASLFTAIAVSIAGPIGFIGLVVPHWVRLSSGSNHRQLIPIAAIVGGNFLVLADSLSQHLFKPIHLPVGVMTALIGAPVFLYLINRSVIKNHD